MASDSREESLFYRKLYKAYLHVFDMDEKDTKQDELLIEAKDCLNSNKRSIGKKLRQGDKAINLDFEDLSSQSILLADKLIESPNETLQLFEIAAAETEWLGENLRIRFDTLSSSQDLQIRNIRAKHLGQMISLDGIIRRASEVRPQVTNIKFECPSCGSIISVMQTEKEQKEPGQCSCGRKGSFIIIAKDMIDSQVMIIEESPDSLEDGGDQPKRLKIFLKEDLTDENFSKKITPGSKVKVIGILKEIAQGANPRKPLVTYDIAVEANNVIMLEEDTAEIEITEEDEREIFEISKRPDLFDYLGKSVAPSVYGNTDIKRALTLQLFSGVSRKRSDGSMSREQIHGLLVGDPGVAKSVILKYLKEISNKSRYVSGKGASGVGLTATATKDELTKEWALEAGAMVLANKGSLFIDEFEKMSEEDRSNLHEGMSIGTISVSKANIQATLNARTSILAAANPKFGRFETDKPFASQINLAPSLLSRFDFIFVMRDIPEETRDTMIANKIFEEHSETEEYPDVLEKAMFKKYVAYAKRFHPKIGESAIKVLKDYYIGLRNRTKEIEGKKIIPIGARQLEGLIRFSEAAAKARLSRIVTISDANHAIKIMETYLKEVGYDEENKTFDIDKVAGNSAKSRNKIDTVRNIIKILNDDVGPVVPVDKIKELLENKLTEDEVDETLEKLVRAGDAFRPKRGNIRLM